MITKTKQRVQLEPIHQLVNTELDAIQTYILTQIDSDIDLINSASQHLINNTGKRMRPLLIVLCAKMIGYKGPHHIHLAAITELLHNATLLHDDVIDDSKLRRGLKTVNLIWGNQASILIGDFLYSLCFKMMNDLKNPAVMKIMAETTHQITRGEIRQMLNAHKTDISIDNYFQVIEAKTASLFESACEIIGIFGNCSAADTQALANYGKHLGIVFQLIDDVLDYNSKTKQLGKQAGDDLAEGKLTLPLILALEHTTPAESKLIKSAIKKGKRRKLSAVLTIIEKTGAIDKTLAIAEEHAALARNSLTNFKQSVYQQSLLDLIEFSLQRRF